MGKNILRKHFQNMYGNNKPLQSNRSTNNLLKNISVNNAEGENVVENKNNKTNIKKLIDDAEKESSNYRTLLPEVSTPSVFGFGGVLLLTAFLFILMVLIYFRDSIFNYFKKLKDSLRQDVIQTSTSYKSLEEKYNNIMNQTLKDTEEANKLHSKNIELDKIIKNKDHEIEELNKSLNQKEEDQQNKQSDIQKGAIGQMNHKLSELCNLKKNTRVLKDGYCYIGYDLGKHECTDVYAGDLCMSGKIFPTMSQCQNPTLR